MELLQDFQFQHILNKNIMKGINILIAMLTFSCSVKGQEFYDMLKETIDSTYLYVKKNNNINKKNPFNCYKLDYYHHPYSFFQKAIEYKGKQREKYLYIGDYDVMLGEDTIIINTYIKKIYKTKLKKRGLFRRIDENKYYFASSPYSLLYIYDRVKNKWNQNNYKRASKCLQWDNEVANYKRKTLENCIDETLNYALNNYTSEYIVNSPNDILVIENSLGAMFFYNHYMTKGFPYLVASIENLTSKEISKYQAIFGWVDIELNGNIFKITIRQIDGKKYSKSNNLKEALNIEYTCYFQYSRIKKSWYCVRKQKQQNDHTK